MKHDLNLDDVSGVSSPKENDSVDLLIGQDAHEILAKNDASGEEAYLQMNDD